MGSPSTPDSPGVRIATVLHDLDRTIGTLDAEHRQALLESVRQWLAHHAPTNERTPHQ